MFNEDEIMRKGMKCLAKELGDVEAEFFITKIKRDKFDYTEWQREYFDKMSTEEIKKEFEEYVRTHPYKGNGEII